jgi:hypothetical protein
MRECGTAAHAVTEYKVVPAVYWLRKDLDSPGDYNETEGEQQWRAHGLTNHYIKKTLRARKLKAEPKQANRKASSTEEASAAAQASRADRTGRRIYSDEKRSQKLGQIGKSIGRGERQECSEAGRHI